MTRSRGMAALLGVVFGFVLCWTGLTNPDTIHGALLFEHGYLFLFFGSAVVTAAAGLQVLRRVRGERWSVERPERRHLTGAVMFGVGWGVTGACPGPIAALIGQGILWGLPLMAGVVIGVRLYLRQGAPETEPARDVELPARAAGAAARS